MRSLIDVNASRSLGTFLINKGYDVAFVSDTDGKMDDEDILTWAVKEKRIIVTTDKDFEQLIWQQNKISLIAGFYGWKIYPVMKEFCYLKMC